MSIVAQHWLEVTRKCSLMLGLALWEARDDGKVRSASVGQSLILVLV